MRGLASLTEPGPDEPVGAIVDLAVMGARGDGKTQFIVHAIRTLRAYAPPLTGAERSFNRDILEVVMHARAPRPEATAPGVVPHYVFRIRPASLLAQVGLAARLTLYRGAGLLGHWLLALLNAIALGALLFGLRGASTAPTPVDVAAAVLALALGMALGVVVARRRFVRQGVIEIVFWDVAGEHVYSGSAADYFGFLGALVERRRERARAPDACSPAYAFAPVLLCNPLALGTRPEGAPFTRLRRLLPMFASLNEPLPHALVAINRWSAAEHLCRPDAHRDEVVAVVARARDEIDSDEIDSDDQADLTTAAANAASAAAATDGAGDDADAGTSDDAAAADEGAGETPTLAPLPTVRRDVVRAHCHDAEDSPDSDVRLSYLRYDAGMQCELGERPWPGWDRVDTQLRRRWQPPRGAAPSHLLRYDYEDGPGAFEGAARSDFLRWLAQLGFHRLSYQQPRSAPAADASIATGATGGDDAGDDPAAVAAAAVGPTTGLSRRRGRRRRDRIEPAGPGPSPAPDPAPAKPTLAEATSSHDGADPAASAPEGEGDPTPPSDDTPVPLLRRRRPAPAAEAPARALSASGLEDFARGAIANAIADEPPAQVAHAADDPDDPDAATAAAVTDPGRRDKKGDTAPLSGGFGTSGT